MFALRVTPPGQPPQTLVFARDEITIGRHPDNELALTDGVVTPRHARIVVRDAAYILVDLKSDNGTNVNGRRITAPVIVHAADTIVIGRHTLAIVDVEAEWTDVDDAVVDGDEARLLRAIGEDGSRIVYADWLEQRGDARAELVRNEQQAPAATTPLRVLALALDTTVRWRARVTRPRIELCASFECPAEWGALAVGVRPDSRHCATCSRNVVYCATVQMARHVTTPVVLDYLSLRWRGDLARR